MVRPAWSTMCGIGNRCKRSRRSAESLLDEGRGRAGRTILVPSRDQLSAASLGVRCRRFDPSSELFVTCLTGPLT
jgi:hypothetical protein